MKADDRVSVAEAADFLGVSRQFIRIGMQRGQLPIGAAVKMSSVWTYYINRQQLIAYKSGQIKAPLQEVAIP